MVISNDNGLSGLVTNDNAVQIATGFAFTEGPIWLVDQNVLLFSDINNQRIHRWTKSTGEVDVYREPSGHSNGLTVDNEGKLLACEHSGRRVSQASYNDSVMNSLADHWDGKLLNSPNDIVVHSNGSIYFTDPTYGLPQPGRVHVQGNPDAEQELSFQGVYKIDPDGKLELLTDIFTQPNGLALSPDENQLYVGDSKDGLIRTFDIDENGRLENQQLFIDMSSDDRPGNPDGMKVDTEGRLWTTGAGGVWVIEPNGTVLGQIEFQELPANIAFGGDNYQTIFLTARTSVYTLEVNVTGIRPPAYR